MTASMSAVPRTMGVANLSPVVPVALGRNATHHRISASAIPRLHAMQGTSVVPRAMDAEALSPVVPVGQARNATHHRISVSAIPRPRAMQSMSVGR